MTNRNPWMATVAAALVLSACTLSAKNAEEAYVRDQMRNYRFPKACEALWVDALKVIAAEGYGLEGNDRKLVGQEAQGAITGFLSRGRATTVDRDGMLEAKSDSDAQFIRYVVQGRPAGADGCFVQYIQIFDDRVNSVERRNREYDWELKLLVQVDPLAAMKIQEAAEKAR
jgi:hypothetical protein